MTRKTPTTAKPEQDNKTAQSGAAGAKPEPETQTAQSGETAPAAKVQEQEAGAKSVAPATGPDEEPSGGLIVVTGPKRGRRRAGRAFGPEPVKIPLTDLSEDDARAIADDPELSVTVIPGG